MRGGIARLCGQAANMLLRVAFLVILARLLGPDDFGLMAMVTAITGFYGLFTSAGLSAATVQSPAVSDEQLSTLFWINLLCGVLLGLICLLSAPALAAFYHDGRLFWLTIFIAAGFPISAAGVQHFAILQRHLRYAALSVIEALSQLAAIAAGVAMALFGFGYWALAATMVVAPAVTTAAVWLTAAWLPGRPRRRAGIGPMLRFGGLVSLNTLFCYIAYNSEKVLLGRYWGADVLGLYGRAYQLIAFPSDYLNGAIGGVAFSALSRLQGDPARLKRYFLNFYSLVVSITLPVTLFCALYADAIVVALLGQKWIAAAPIFRLLAPTVLIFGIINPLAWLLMSIGLQARSLRIAMVIAPLVIGAYLIGLRYGPGGVAFAYSTAMALWLVPHVLWCLRGTMIAPRDLLPPVGRPLASGLAAGLAALALRSYLDPMLPPLLAAAMSAAAMFAVYAAMLLIVFGQGPVYLGLLRLMRGGTAIGTAPSLS